MFIKIKDIFVVFIVAEWYNLSFFNWSMWEDTIDWWCIFYWGFGWIIIFRSGTGLWRSNYVWIYVYIYWFFFLFGFVFFRFWFNFLFNDVDNICKWRENCFLLFFFKYFYVCRKCIVYWIIGMKRFFMVYL